jgi:hypothetical protein
MNNHNTEATIDRCVDCVSKLTRIPPGVSTACRYDLTRIPPGVSSVCRYGPGRKVVKTGVYDGSLSEKQEWNNAVHRTA